MLSRSLVRKLISYFLLLNIATVILVGSYSYYRAKAALVERTFDQLTSIRIEKKYRIENLFEDRIEDINLIAKSDDVSRIIDLLKDKGSDNTKLNEALQKEYNRFLKRHFFSNRNYESFQVANSQGRSVFFATGESDSAMSINATATIPIKNLITRIIETCEITIDDFEFNNGTDPHTIYIGAPVYDGAGRIKGVVVTELDIESINSIMYENNPHNGLGETGESYLVGSDYLMRSTSRFEDNSVFQLEAKTIGVREALKGNTGTSIIDDYRGIPVFSSYSKVNITGLEWAILAEIDQKEAMIPVYSIRNNILYLGFLMSLLLFAIVYIIARRISLPILKLKDAAEKISGDNYDVTVDNIESKDEIGSLVKAFNEMSGRINEQSERLKQERTMRLSSMIDGQELERLRLSRELHDGLGQSILAIKMRLEKSLTAPPDKAKLIMDEVNMLISNTITEIRSISQNLLPAELSHLGLIDALRNLCNEVTKSSGIEIKFVNENTAYVNKDKTNTYLYRISQEALNNIIKHSEATGAWLKIEAKDDKLFLSISDNGKGFKYNPESKICGNGITNMKERVDLLNGSFELKSTPGKGTIIEVSVPMKLE